METETKTSLRASVERHRERLLEVYGRAFLNVPPTASMDALSELLDELDALLSDHPATGPSDDAVAAAYWQGRFLRMRAMYRERFNEGLSSEQWHRKHCALMADCVTEDELAETIWTASRADEGTISATGANHVARALLATFRLAFKSL